MRSSLILMLLVLMAGCGQPEREPAAGGSSERLIVPPRDAGFEKASEVYGELFIRNGEYSAEARARPWSSWWFPTRETYLFREDGDQLAPLQKYDRYVSKTGRRSAAAKFEEQFLFDPAASAWEGRCDAWSIASLMEIEPVVPVTRAGITFGVGDLKALLVKKYESFQGTQMFGQRYNGNRVSVFDDIYADQFHLLLQQELFERGRPFIMDKDPGAPVWNTPVWKAETRISPDPDRAHVRHVTTWIFGASPFVTSYDYVGTLSVVFEYTYDLFGEPQSDGSFLVRYGEWTGSSMDYHPDFLTVMPDASVTESLNKELDVTVIDEIVQGR
ncbi:MAG: hypothetical protein A2X94_16690 [Bdellovibrionales bacterium GWB1_55_8]|nr:MAG: hypothetical protein A2X94_16690 [Bdellovibrionales bacterium GWB1_55_8]